MTKAHNMQAIFADNMDTLLGKHNMKELVANANQHGTLLDYTYFMAMRRGKANASIEKCEIAVEILRNVPGFDWVEVWMFFVPQYFKQYQTNALKETSLDAVKFDALVRELLVTGHRLQFLCLSEQQFEQTAELARYIYQSRTGESPEATMPSSSRAV
ncbi:hypothetical protein CBX96_03980 [Shewanella sp. BC20]|uniref:hypothetical protein n=1 Tax=Shewanella sp. BC20 TaxID=2004459 RepID=UPI000D65B9D6|nr:hypothetical protein [Shewanella sp. BC20]PWF64931.1 hypothetical protein CBX96_03980 [Shewanella sp. BC20]